MTFNTALSPGLFWLTMTALATALMWVPYILDRFVRSGLGPTLGFGKDIEIVQSKWAWRAKAAHANAVENLVIFATAVLVTRAMEAGSPMVAMACQVYFVARMGHYVVYTLGIPMLRTACFLAGCAAQVYILACLLFH